MLSPKLAWDQVLACLLVAGLLAGCSATGPASLATPAAPRYLNRALDRLAPPVPAAMDKQLFAHYQNRAPSAWAGNWTRSLDFSGVAWDNSRGGTLIHPQFMVLASHFQRRIGDEVVFHDRHGQPIARRITAKKIIHKVRQPDITVAMLDRPVPASVAYYRMPPSTATHAHWRGAKLLVTDKKRQVHLFQISQINAGRFEELVARPGFAEQIHPAWAKRLVAGDSGHPSFLVLDGRLVLASTLRGGGWAFRGPFFGGANVQAALREAMSQLASAGKGVNSPGR